MEHLASSKAKTECDAKCINRTCIAYDDSMMSENRRLVAYSFPLFPLKYYPERPERIKAIIERLKFDRLLEKCYRLKSRSATDEELQLCHKKHYIDLIKSTEKMTSDKEFQEFGSRYKFVIFNEDTYKMASMACGSLLEMVDNICSSRFLNGFACIRPPGHHSDQENASGFCFFNNVAVAAKYAIQKWNKTRVLIVDWDLHHGDGIQQILKNDDRVLYVSLHNYDNGKCFPRKLESNYDFESENIINIPWNDDPMSDMEYLSSFFNIVLPVSYQFNPDLVLVSCGFDAAIGDPLGNFQLSPEVYGHMTHFLMSLANGRVILVLEGGYNLESISLAASNCVSVLLGDPPKPLKLTEMNKSAIKTIKNVTKHQSTNLKVFSNS